jgi:hypothetical protein
LRYLFYQLLYKNFGKIAHHEATNGFPHVRAHLAYPDFLLHHGPIVTWRPDTVKML